MHLQWCGCVVPRLYMCLNRFVIFCVMVYGSAFSKSGARSFGSVALPELIWALAFVLL